jgi:DNA-binding XRE family transcriptional regulator
MQSHDSRRAGARIRDMRRGEQMTQQQLADTVGVSRVTIVRWEQGRQDPTLRQAVALASAFDVALDTLFGGEEA